MTISILDELLPKFAIARQSNVTNKGDAPSIVFLLRNLKVHNAWRMSDFE
jgi:hypothetical protein